MIRTTPFHERTSALNETGLWEHWSNHLVAVRYQMSEKFEYFAIRNSAGLFDSSPLYKYRITGAGCGAVPGRRAGPRHPRRARPATRSTRPGATTAASSSRTASSCATVRRSSCSRPPSRTSPTSRALIGRLDVGIEEVTDDWAVLAVQGPRARGLLGDR